MDPFGIPDWTSDAEVDWSSLPGSEDKKYKRVTIRMPDGTTKEVVIEAGLNPRLIPPPGGKDPEPSDDVAGFRPPPTIDDKIREQDTFLGKLKVAGSFALDPVGTVYGPEAHRQAVEDLGDSTVGRALHEVVSRGAQTVKSGITGDAMGVLRAITEGEVEPWAEELPGVVAEKGMQMASSPVTGYFAVPGVPTSVLGRVAALGFGGMAAKGGGEQLGEAISMAEDQGLGWESPEVQRRLVSGGIDLAMAPAAVAGALHGEPLARVRALGGPTVGEAVGAVGREAADFARFANPMREGPLGSEAGVVEFGGKKPLGPVEPDMVEVYRSGDGSFFTTNAERAASYPGKMTKVRIPRDVFEAGRAEAAKLGQPTPQDTVLPDEWVRQATEVEKPDVTISGTELPPDERASLFAELGIEEAPPAGPVEPVIPKAEPPQAGRRTFATPEEEGAALMDIINSDASAEAKMMAQLRLEEIVNPEIPDAAAVDRLNLLEAEKIAAEEGAPPARPPVQETVRPANVTPPAGVEVKKVPSAAAGEVKNLNDVIDTMYGKGTRVKAAQVKEAREVYAELTRTAKGETPTLAELQATLEKRKGAAPQQTTVPPKPETPPAEAPPTPEPPEVRTREMMVTEAKDPNSGLGQLVTGMRKNAKRSAWHEMADDWEAWEHLSPDEAAAAATVEPKLVDWGPEWFKQLVEKGKRTPEQKAQIREIGQRGFEEATTPEVPIKALEGATPPGKPVWKFNAEENRWEGYRPWKDPAQYSPDPDIQLMRESLKNVPDNVKVDSQPYFGSDAPKRTKAEILSELDAIQRRRKPAAPLKEKKPLSEMTPEEMETEAVAAENRVRGGQPAPDFERASTLRRLAEQKRTQAARDAQIEATRQKSAAATREAVEAETHPAKPAEPEVAGPVRPLSEAYTEPIGPKRPRGRPPKAENPLEAKIPTGKRPERVNPVEVFTGERPEPPAPVEPVKKPPMKQAQADVDTVSQKVTEETGVDPNKAPADLSTPDGKKFVKSVAKNMGITEDKAAALVGGQTAPKSSRGGGGPATPAPGGKTVPGAGKTVRGPSGGGPPGATPPGQPPTPRLPRPKGKRPTYDILEWMRARRAGKVQHELTRRRFESLPKGVQAQMDFETGTIQLPQVRKFLDGIHRQMRQAGVDVGYVENYLTHLWKESPAEVRAKLGRRLGLKPGIAMTRSIPTLAEGIQKGLTPKFENMSDVLAWYKQTADKAIADRGFFEWLRDQKQIKVAGKAPHDWVTLDPDHFPIRRWKGNTVQFKAPKELANKINEYLYDPSLDPRTFVQGLHKVAGFSSFLKNIRLAAGVPFTKLNMHSFSVMAHHVLSTPTTKGVVPNIPRMIGRGLKDFGEMLDPRLHKWTNQELRRAKLMQEYGPLTLSTEDHVFAPDVRGSLAKRLKEAKNVPAAFKTLIDRMFEEPLFQSHLPKMKLNVAWELQKQFRKEGMGRRQAMEAAGEVTNNFFGGLNLDEVGRSKIGQDLARIAILAPDWLESNLRTVKGIVKSPLGRTPKERVYRDFAVNLMGTYVAGTILQKALTGQWMHENTPGNQFSVYLGKNPENGKDRYVKPYGAGLAGVRMIYDTAESVGRRQDISKFGDLVRNRLAIPLGTASSLVFNKGPFGQPVLRKGDTLGGQLASVGALAAGQATPQYVLGPVAALRGQISPEFGLAQAIEFPYTEVTHRNPEESTPPKKRRRRRRR